MSSRTAQSIGLDSRVRGFVRSADRLQIVFAVLFTVSLVIGTTFWDAMAFPVSRAEWAGIAASLSLCVLFLLLCRHRWPLLLCGGFFVSIRLAFALAGSPPPGSVLFYGDCFAVCLAFSAITLRTEMMQISLRVRDIIHAKSSRVTPVPESQDAVATNQVALALD